MATGCPGLDVPRPDLPDVVHFVGRVAPAGTSYPPAPEGWRKASGRPLVLVTQGTSDVDPGELLQPALRGLGGLDVDVLATGGQRGRTGVGLEPPANARVVDLIDFKRVLPKTAVVVTNGGWGGVLTSLSAGVPLVVAPGGAADKPEIAARIARFGVGVNLKRRRVSPAAVAAAVSEVLGNPSYAKRAQGVAAELEWLGGAGTAADLLEQLAETRAPVRRTSDPWPNAAALSHAPAEHPRRHRD